MPEVEIGARRIEYDIRTSTRAGRKRIEVTPGQVEVIVPDGTPADEIEAFVQRRRRWLHEKTEEVAELVEELRRRTPEGYHSGAKVLFRGRHLRVRIETDESVEEPTLCYRTAFQLKLPPGLSEQEREKTAQSLIEEWMERRLEQDAREVVRRRGKKHGLEPRDIRIKDQRTLWGSCGKDRVLRLDRKLSRVPGPVFEYVVVHELCHLEHRDHSEEFWELVRRVLPDYEERKEWLEEHEVRVG